MGDSSFRDSWLLDSLADGLVLIDGDWRVAFINHAAEALLQLRREEVLTRHADEALRSVPREWSAALHEVMESRHPRPLDEIRVPRPGPDRYFAGEVRPSPTGGIVIVFRDVSERKHDEETLRLRDRAMAASTNGIVLTDATRPDTPIVYVNPAFCRITGYAPEEVLGQNCRFLQRSDRDQPPIEEIRTAVRNGHSCTVTLRNYRRDGSCFWNELSIAPVHDETGKLTHFVGIQQDVTNRVRVQNDLVERNQELKVARDTLAQRNTDLSEATQAKDRFMATMSHEMRTPLNAILGYVELLNIGVAGELNEMQRVHVSRIGTSGRALLELINDVLDFTRAEVGKLSLEFRPLNVAAVVEEASELIRLSATDKHIDLKVEIPDAPLPWVRGDFRRLRQILTNLLSNAVKFTHEGSITIRVRPQGNDRIAISVTDTGIGISQDKAPRIFEEFYQADSNLTREYGGTGLGLAISQRLARLMGGTLSVESREDHGSTFTLTLPVILAESGQEAIQTSASLAAPEPESGAPSIVVVAFGPNEGSIDALRRKLEPHVRVLGTTVPDHVPELARRDRAALIVLDVACQQGVGWEAAHAVREDPELDDVAMLLLPCFPEDTTNEAVGALDLGWVTVVPKPFNSRQLTRMVQRAASRGETTDTSPATLDVLVVDDDPDAREIAGKILAASGVRVREAYDGEDGLAEMRRTPPDVAVLDLMMPVLDGFGVLAAMRADPVLSDIPVVVLTAKDLSDAERRFLARTAETVLQKGVHPLSDVASLILRAAHRGADAQRSSRSTR